MNKYQALIELYDKMTRNIVNQRPKSCQQILNDKNSWALIDNEFNINKEFKEYSDNCDEEYKKSIVYKVMELLAENPKFNFRYNSDFEDSDSPALKRMRTNSCSNSQSH